MMKKWLFLLLLWPPLTTCLGGIFELRLLQYSNPSNRDASGLCCSLNESDCRSGCDGVKFKICVKNYQVSIEGGNCFFGESVVEFDEKNGTLHFPFNFRWPGTFSLLIEALTPDSRQISLTAVQQYLDMGLSWKQREWTSEKNNNIVVGSSGNLPYLKYAYRVRCLPDYYGEACDKTCRGRDDTFGHYTCSEFGDRVCIQGWSGEYCETASCPAGCSPSHASCPTPTTCTCHQGWTGPLCSECIPYPGCKHGKCSKPFECECQEGWGGLFCNQDLNYCTNHQPCANGGTCFNTGQGSYTCECLPGWGGVDCDVRVSLHVSGGCGEVCLNGGRCVHSVLNSGGSGSSIGNKTTYYCSCPPSYTGPTCATPTLINSICLTSPCANGGTCISKTNLNFTCTCAPNFTGDDCSEKVTSLELLETTEAIREELSTQHVVIVVCLSIATPLMVVVAVGVLLLLKRRRELEEQREDGRCRRENEENVRRKLERGEDSGGDLHPHLVVGGVTNVGNNIGKINNLLREQMNSNLSHNVIKGPSPLQQQQQHPPPSSLSPCQPSTSTINFHSNNHPPTSNTSTSSSNSSYTNPLLNNCSNNLKFCNINSSSTVNLATEV